MATAAYFWQDPMLWASLAALATVATALVTGLYTYFTMRLWRSQIEPKVIVYSRHDSDRRTILTIVISNIGRDIASDIRFSTDRPIPAQAYGLDPKSASPAAEMADGPLVKGIPSLGPGDSRVITWGQYGGLKAALGNKSIEVTYTYRHGKRKFSDKAQLEVDSYSGTDASEPPIVGISKSLKEIAKSAASISASLHNDRS